MAIIQTRTEPMLSQIYELQGSRSAFGGIYENGIDILSSFVLVVRV